MQKDDVIYRQAAIEALESIGSLDTDADREYARGIFNALPSAESERKKGRWIKVSGKPAINCSACRYCSWSLSFEDTVRRFNFCPNCGADMRGEQNED